MKNNPLSLFNDSANSVCHSCESRNPEIVRKTFLDSRLRGNDTNKDRALNYGKFSNKVELIKQFEKIVGRDNLSCIKEDLVCYSYDANTQGKIPDLVIFPKSTEEISQILKIVNQNKIFITVRGSGTGMTGGSIPLYGGIVLAMNRLNKILKIDKDNLIAVVQPGLITGDFKEALAKENLFYPPDPSSFAFSTIGGNVAECAGGPNAVKYGVTKDYILGLTCVLPNGDIIKTGVETKKGVVGYDLTKILIGSEGTLAVITEIIIKLIPKPETNKTAIAIFKSIDDATKTVSKIISSGTCPSSVEFMDKASINCVKNSITLPLPENTNAILIIQTDGTMQECENKLQAIKELCIKNNAEYKIAENKIDEENIWKARKLISPALFKYGKDKINEDIVVPVSKIPLIVQKVEELMQKTNLMMVCFGHAGDGNIHFNIMLDKKNKEELELAEKVLDEIFNYVIKLGGTISGEHGIGISKKDFISKEIDPITLELMKKIKKVFDPNGVLNPGKIFPNEKL